MAPPIHDTKPIERLIREDWGRALAALTRWLGDMSLAEDALQDAVVRALEVWPERGIPKSPIGWLITTARRRALDRIRRDATLARNASLIALQAEADAMTDKDATQTGAIPDERLELIFTCCHPAIEQKSQIALTLRALGGLSTGEIAAAFLDKTTAMAARLTRAKAKIKGAGIPYRVPGPDDLPERTQAVCRVIYLIFNEGYRSSTGADYLRTDLSNEAIRLGRILRGLLPKNGEVAGLLALMLLHDSRRLARSDDRGRMVALEDQNRARWDRGRIAEGMRTLDHAIAHPPRGAYVIQAAISALHAQAPDFASTDWSQIAALYASLHQIEPNPVVLINRAVAESYGVGADKALASLDKIGATHDLDQYQPYFAARADILARLGHGAQAATAYGRAIELCANASEREFLQMRLAGLSP